MRVLKENRIETVVTTCFLVAVCLRLFWKLGDIGVTDTDEAWHAINALEMLKSGNWLVNTFDYQVDYYNTKPPLGLWTMVLSMRTFGTTIAAMKLPSACAGLLSCLVLTYFLWKRFGVVAGAALPALFLTLRQPMDYHGFRAGDFDGIYLLFFAVAVIALYEAARDNRWIILFAFCVGMAFMAKQIHAAAIFAVGVCYLPVLRKNWNWKNCGFALLAGGLPVLLWAIPRYRFDGWHFLLRATYDAEMVNKDAGMDYGFFVDMVHQEIFILLGAVLLLRLMVLAMQCGKDAGKWRRAIKGDIKVTGLFWIWMLVTILLFSLIGTYITWYLYPAYLAAAVLAAVYLMRLYESLGVMEKQTVGRIVVAVLFLACAGIGAETLTHYPNAGEGGGPSLGFYHDIQGLKEKYGDTYDGKEIYIHNASREQADTAIDFFHDDMRVYAQYLCDFQVRSGGVAAWLDHPDALLVLNKEYWDAYSGILTGYVILEDNYYLIFENKRYGEER